MPRLPQFLTTCFLFAHAAMTTADEIDFARDIRPILSDNCYHCHGPDERAREADLRLDTKQGLFRRVDGTTVVAPGNVSESELIRRVTSNDGDERMPPLGSNRSLTSQQVELLKTWVESGAVWKGHWSFQPITQPKVPDGERAIDYFVGRRLKQEGLQPSSEASKERLLRRVTFDLTGLPPTIAELDAFLSDESQEPFEKVVDRLLKSPHYGERMAWEWLDAARYADTNGFQGDRERTMWPWRDWVIRAFNKNMPFDQFTVWQLAGDLLPEATIEQRLATGFNRNHMINGEGGRIPEENRIEYVFDQMETMGTVWMGLTLQCCRCHDHKFDPLTRREYYQLFAFFNQTPVNGGGGDPQTAPNLAFASPEQETQRARLHRETDNARALIEQAEKTLLDKNSNGQPSDEEITQIRDILTNPVLQRNNEQFATMEKFGDKHAPEYAKLVRAFRAKRKQRDDQYRSLPRVMVMQDMAKPRKTFMLTKGAYNQPTQEVTSDTPAIFRPLPTAAPKNRLTLAKWLVDPLHPLAARVTVNRHWQMFFGAGLVKTSEDFGSQGERPSHPDLLDWLASQFVQSGWNLKQLHKTIVMSATYRQTAKASRNSIAYDSENRLLSRGPRFRMSSWMIRDHALSTSGLLVDKLGGRPVNPYQPANVWAEATFGKKKYTQGKGKDLYRRSLYSFWRRIVGPTMFFDEAKRQTCSVRPGRTNTPLHALTTMNDITYVEAARALAQRVMKFRDQDAGRIETVFRRVTSRKPTGVESGILLTRLNQLKSQYAADPDEARQLLAVGDSPRDEKLDPIEHAAYTGLCSLILNLDEALTK
ncbi:MAG: chromosome segregation protein [Planctomycetaceae bacterium]|nr:chromosome segregation protein [Planctomycetaceae bacterium]